MSGWVLVSLLKEQQEFQRLQADDARAAAARVGLEARVVFSDNDPTRQIQQMSEAIAAPAGARPLAILAETASSVGFERVARSALEAGVGWILSGSGNPKYVEFLRKEFPDLSTAAVSIDNHQVGMVLGRMAVALLPAGGRVVVIEGPSANAATLQRRHGLEEGLRGSAIQVMKSLGADWTVAGATRATETWLKLAGKGVVRPDLLVAMNDESAVGALQAIRSIHPEWEAIPALGCDGLPEGGQKLTRTGTLAGTVVLPSGFGTAVEFAAAWARGKRGPALIPLDIHAFPPVEQLAPLRR